MMTAEPAGDLRPDRSSKRLHPGTATGVLAGGTLTQLMASMGTPWAFDPPRGLRAVPRRHRRASVSHPSHADAGRAGRHLRQGTGDRVRRVSRLRRARRRSGDPGRAARLHRGLPRAGAVQISIGSHQRADVDAAVRRRAPRSSAAPSPVVRDPRGRGQTLDTWRAIHLIGICGTAMATLAALLKHRGHDVSGSDEHVYPPMSDFLAAERITVLEGYQPEHVDGAIDLVVVGNAISRGNAELEAVLDRGMRYASLPETIRDQWLWDAQSIVIAGTHGKTTTTSLDRLAADRRRRGSDGARRRHRAQLRRRRRELSHRQGQGVRHRRRRVRQRLLRQDREVPEVPARTSRSSTTSSSITPTSTPISTRCASRSGGSSTWCRGAA